MPFRGPGKADIVLRVMEVVPRAGVRGARRLLSKSTEPEYRSGFFLF